MRSHATCGRFPSMPAGGQGGGRCKLVARLLLGFVVVVNELLGDEGGEALELLGLGFGHLRVV